MGFFWDGIVKKLIQKMVTASEASTYVMDHGTTSTYGAQHHGYYFRFTTIKKCATSACPRAHF
jgi:hypothetical protein